MHGSLAVLLSATASLYCVQSAQWLPSPIDDTFIYACAGLTDVIFPWGMELESDEKISCVEWFHSQASQQQTTAASQKGVSEGSHSDREQSMIAMFSHGLFLPTPTFSKRLQQEGILGLRLSHVTEEDGGKYSVEAMVMNVTSEVATKFVHTLTLVVYSQDSARRDASVTLRQMPTAVWGEETDQYHVQLTCTANGRQPRAVIFTLPSGESQMVSKAENGHFHLLVPNPVSGGNYTCRVHDSDPAATCLPSGSPELGGDTVRVDSMEARLLLLEAEQRTLKTENKRLVEDNGQLKADVREQAAAIENFQAESREMKRQLNDLVSKRVAFHTRVSGSAQFKKGERLVLTDVVYNQGGGYSSSTGAFTAPHSGTYAFLVSLIPTSSSNEAEVRIKVDGTEINRCDSYYNNPRDAHACFALIHMDAQQTVWLDAVSDGSVAHYGTGFSGFLVSPDP